MEAFLTVTWWLGCTFGADLHAQSVLIDRISASEFSRKFIKSALLVGYYNYLHADTHTNTGKQIYFLHQILTTFFFLVGVGRRRGGGIVCDFPKKTVNWSLFLKEKKW